MAGSRAASKDKRFLAVMYAGSQTAYLVAATIHQQLPDCYADQNTHFQEPVMCTAHRKHQRHANRISGCCMRRMIEMEATPIEPDDGRSQDS